MKLDLTKISKIKNLKDLKNYDINKPLFWGNYLFQYLIMLDKLDILKLDKFPIHVYNADGLNGFHLAAKYNNYKILNYFIKNNSKHIYDLSAYKTNFLFYLIHYDNELLNFIKNNKLDWPQLFQEYNVKNICSLDLLFVEADFKIIDTIINKFKFKWDKYNYKPSYYFVLNNKNLKVNEIVKIFETIRSQDKKILQYADKDGNNIAFYTANLNIIKYFHDKKVILDYYTPFLTRHVFAVNYSNSNTTNKYDIPKFIWSTIRNTHDFSETNKDGDNLPIFIVKNILLKNKHDKNFELELDILNKNDKIDLINLEGNTLLNYLVNLDFNTFKGVLKNKEFTLPNKKILKNINKDWKEFLKDVPVLDCKKKSNNKTCFNIIFNKYSYNHGNLFNSTFQDLAIFFIEISKKYKNLYLPKIKDNNKDIKNEKFGNSYLPDFYLNNYLKFPWIILYNAKNNSNYFSKDINSLLKAQRNKDFAVMFISYLTIDGILHANLLIFDYNKKIVERFEPFGNLFNIDDKMDKIFESKIKDFKYIPPEEYMPYSAFQTLSDELNLKNQKQGDIGGFCLAWCFFYLEHKLINKDVPSGELVEKLIRRIKFSKNSFSEYIRNYANSINKLRTEFLKKINIPNKIISNIEFSQDIEKKINQEIIKYHQ